MPWKAVCSKPSVCAQISFVIKQHATDSQAHCTDGSANGRNAIGAFHAETISFGISDKYTMPVETNVPLNAHRGIYLRLPDPRTKSTLRVKNERASEKRGNETASRADLSE